MRVEVVTEQEGGVAIGGREQPRAAVMDEVALVDRLEPERMGGRREGREHRLRVAFVLRAERVGPARGLSAAAASAIAANTAAD